MAWSGLGRGISVWPMRLSGTCSVAGSTVCLPLRAVQFTERTSIDTALVPWGRAIGVLSTGRLGAPEMLIPGAPGIETEVYPPNSRI